MKYVNQKDNILKREKEITMNIKKEEVMKKTENF